MGLFALKVQLDHLKDKKWAPEFREPIRVVYAGKVTLMRDRQH